MIEHIVDELYPPLATTELEELERTLGVTLPDDYRSFLLKHNGAHIRPYFVFPVQHAYFGNEAILQDLFGIHPEPDDNVIDLYGCHDTYTRRMPPNLLPIGSDPGGNMICLSICGQDCGRVYYWDHEGEMEWDEGEVPDYRNVYLVADSFAQLLQSLAELQE